MFLFRFFDDKRYKLKRSNELNVAERDNAISSNFSRIKISTRDTKMPKFRINISQVVNNSCARLANAQCKYRFSSVVEYADRRDGIGCIKPTVNTRR